MTYVVTASQTGIFADMINIDFASMPCHSLGESPNITASASKETIPQPHICPQFGIIPGKPAYIVSPLMTDRIVGMHEISIIPKSIPSVLFHGSLVIVNILIQLVLNICTK